MVIVIVIKASKEKYIRLLHLVYFKLQITEYVNSLEKSTDWFLYDGNIGR